MQRSSSNARRGVAAVAAVVLLLLLNLIVLGLVLDGTRGNDLTLKRVESVQAFYAAEAGINMSIREMMVGCDEDGDGVIGKISDDATDANDPIVGIARVVVTQTVAGGATTLVSRARAGTVRRQAEAILE